MTALQITILIIVGIIVIPLWLYFIAYMMESAKLNAHRDFRRTNGRE